MGKDFSAGDLRGSSLGNKRFLVSVVGSEDDGTIGLGCSDLAMGDAVDFSPVGLPAAFEVVVAGVFFAALGTTLLGTDELFPPPPAEDAPDGGCAPTAVLGISGVWVVGSPVGWFAPSSGASAGSKSTKVTPWPLVRVLETPRNSFGSFKVF